MNTAIIIARGIEMGYTTPAASECAALTTGGKTDWFLPSRDELNELYKARVFSSSQDTYWWSSTQNIDYGAWAQNFENGYSYSGIFKVFGNEARAVRAF